MSSEKIYVDEPLVQRLVKAQFSQWQNLPIKSVASSGWDNRTFHLGENMSVRMPSAQMYVQQVEKEHYWLPKLAPQLPLKRNYLVRSLSQTAQKKMLSLDKLYP